VQHALGLLLARRHEYAEALGLLRRAHELAPDDACYTYVYAIALNSTVAPAEVIALLEQAY
jgi:Flp pilus assembly protein TadD